MEFQWKYAQPLIAKLDPPDYGSQKRWMDWYEKAWGHLSKSGLTQVEAPLDDIRVRLRILALCWLSHDYCAAVENDEWASCPYWSEWIKCLDINPIWALLTAIDQESIKNLVAESGLTSSDDIWEEEEDGIIVEDDKINRDLVPRLVMAAVHSQRRHVIGALMDGFGRGELFVSMHLNCYPIENMVEERRDRLEQDLEDLQEQLDHGGSDDVLEQLHKQIEGVQRQLEEKALIEAVMDDMLDSIGGPIFHGDEDSGERARGCGWCMEGCPVVVRGEPEFYLP